MPGPRFPLPPEPLSWWVFLWHAVLEYSAGCWRQSLPFMTTAPTRDLPQLSSRPRHLAASHHPLPNAPAKTYFSYHSSTPAKLPPPTAPQLRMPPHVSVPRNQSLAPPCRLPPPPVDISSPPLPSIHAITSGELTSSRPNAAPPEAFDPRTWTLHPHP